MGAHGFQDVPGGDGVLLQIPERVIGAEAHVGVGGQVEDHFGAWHRCPQRIQVQYIRAHQVVARITRSARYKFLLAGGEVIERHYLMAVLEEPVY